LRALDLENNARGDERRTLFERRLEVARTILLEKSLDVNAQNNDGETALLRAVRLDNVELVKLLLARSALLKSRQQD
jgi:ankyrin repeat protein